MKIIYDFEGFMPFRGGVARLFVELAKYGFSRDDIDFHVCSGAYRSLYLKEEIELKKKCFGLYIPPPLNKYRLLMPLNRAVFSAYSQYHQADLCHYTNLDAPYVPKKTKTVITVHDLIDEIFHPLGMKCPRAIERRRALDRADGIICVSEHTKQDLLKFYPDVDPKTIEVIYNGNHIQRVKPAAVSYRHPYLLYVGVRRSAYKNFGLVLKALAKADSLSEYHLICFGGGGFTLEELLLIRKLGLADRVVQLGGTDEELVGYYKNAFAFVYPSKYEGFGIPPIEAMSLGCPLVLSNAPPMPEVNGDGGLYFSPDSEDEFIDRLEQLMDEKIRKKYVEKGLQRAGLFTWKRTCEKTFAFYETVMGR